MNYRLNDIVLDKTLTPAWADKIKRWSQLDDASFVLAEASFQNLDFLKQNFDQLIVVSNQGSSHTDRLFVTDKKISPSHFVHTLPNVRTIVFSIITGWEGAIFCFSMGEKTLVNFLKEQAIAHQNEKTLIISLNKIVDVFQCDFYVLDHEAFSLPLATDDFSFRKNLKDRSL